MPRSVWFAFLFLLLPLSVTAQDFPKFELSGGYSFFHVSSGLSPDSTAFAADDSNLHGWNVTAVGNLTRRFGLEADFGGYGGNIDLRDLRFEGETFFVTDATFNTYLFGPRLSYRTDGRLTPFVHALLGAVTVKGAMLSNRSSLGFVLGGGLDIVATRHFAVRMIQADYVRTQLDSFAKDNLRISAGAVIRF